MALTDKLTAIADAIRAKSGKTDVLTLDEMPTEIEALSAEEQLKASEYPSYVTPEVLEVVNKVRSVQQSDSIISIMISDSHYPAEQTTTSDYSNNKASSLQANMAMKAMAYLLDVDFVAHLGDVSCGASHTTPDMLKSQIEGFLSYFKEAKSDIPVFLAVGNHDGGIYYHNAQADGNNYCMTGEYLYDVFTSQSASDDTVFGDATYGGYCYRDFADKKLRVFLLNTSEGITFKQTDSCTLGSQRLWLANALLDLNSKSDATDWCFVVLCHYPADYGGTMPLSELFKAYVDGGSVTIKGITVEDFTDTTINFSGQNGAKFIAQFHGHVHNFISSKLSTYETGSGVQYDAWRMCVPNCQYNRENYYSTVGAYTDINFSEATAYHKTADTENGTSFVVNVINPSEEKIYSFCYGAGYDRVVGYGTVTYYSISRALTNVTSDNATVSVEEGQAYSETLTLDSECDMQSITVTMGGVDISERAITIVDGAYKISIPEVTGDIIITAEATSASTPSYTNLIPLSTTTKGGSEIYNSPYGYKTGYRLNSSNQEVSATNMCCTGFMPLTGKSGDVIRIKNVTISGGAAPYFMIYSATAHMSTLTTSHLTGGGESGILSATIDNDVIVITVNDSNAIAMRLSCGVIDDTSIITVNEEIT